MVESLVKGSYRSDGSHSHSHSHIHGNIHGHIHNHSLNSTGRDRDRDRDAEYRELGCCTPSSLTASWLSGSRFRWIKLPTETVA
jgi:hypothetical protein